MLPQQLLPRARGPRRAAGGGGPARGARPRGRARRGESCHKFRTHIGKSMVTYAHVLLHTIYFAARLTRTFTWRVCLSLKGRPSARPAKDEAEASSKQISGGFHHMVRTRVTENGTGFALTAWTVVVSMLCRAFTFRRSPP